MTKVIAIFICAFLLRLISLDQSLWLDEAITAQTIRQYSYADLILKFSSTDFHPPFYYIFMKFWTGIFGFSEVALRMPSVVFSLLTGWVVYRLGGLWSAAFFLFNPLIIYYSQEARLYMMVTMFISSALLHFNTILKAKYSVRPFIYCNIFVFLSMITFYGSILFILTLCLYLIYKKKIQLLWSVLPGFVIAVLLLSPLLNMQYIHSRTMLAFIPGWSQLLGKATLKNLLLIPLKFSVGRIDFQPKIVYYLIGLIWTTFVGIIITLGAFKHKRFAVYLTGPVVLGFVLSFFTPLLQYFRFLYLIPVFAYLIAAGAQNVIIKRLLLAGFIIFSLIYVLIPSFHREDWKSLTSALPRSASVYMIYTASDPVAYYRPDVKIYDILTAGSSKGKNEVYVIPYLSQIYGVDYKSLLETAGYKQRVTMNFRDLQLELWRRSVGWNVSINITASSSYIRRQMQRSE